MQDVSSQSRAASYSPALRGAPEDSAKTSFNNANSQPPGSKATDAHTRSQTDKALAGLQNSTLRPGSSKTLDTQTDGDKAAETDEEEGLSPQEKEARALHLNKNISAILEFPEDLDGPNNPALLGFVEPIAFDETTQLQGMLAASSRLLRPPCRYSIFKNINSLLSNLSSEIWKRQNVMYNNMWYSS